MKKVLWDFNKITKKKNTHHQKQLERGEIQTHTKKWPLLRNLLCRNQQLPKCVLQDMYDWERQREGDQSWARKKKKKKWEKNEILTDPRTSADGLLHYPSRECTSWGWATVAGWDSSSGPSPRQSRVCSHWGWGILTESGIEGGWCRHR